VELLEQPVAEKKAPLKCDHARAPQEPVQGLRYGPLRARVPEEPVQGLRYGPLHAQATQEPVQGLRYGPLLARATQEQVQGLRYGPLLARAPGGSLQGLQCIGNSTCPGACLCGKRVPKDALQRQPRQHVQWHHLVRVSRGSGWGGGQSRSTSSPRSRPAAARGESSAGAVPSGGSPQAAVELVGVVECHVSRAWSAS
jgi:hypothetical protein